MFRLIHISDLHTSICLRNISFWRFFNKRLFGYLNWSFNRKKIMKENVLNIILDHIKNNNPDHISICGDLVNLSLDNEFLFVKSKIEKLGSNNSISIVLGNHDTYILGSFKKACSIFSQWMNNNKNIIFPYMKVRENIAIIGLSSAIAMPPFFSSGYIGLKQIKYMCNLLKEAKEKKLFRIIMMHHSPIHNDISYNKRLLFKKKFFNVIKKYGVELIIHGHTHLMSLNFVTDIKGKLIPIVGVSSTSQTFCEKKHPAGYNLFEINKNNKFILTRYGIIDKNNNIKKIDYYES